MIGNGKATVWQAVAIQGATSARLHIQHNAIRGIQMFANDQEIDFNIEPEVMQFEGTFNVFKVYPGVFIMSLK